MPGGRASGGSGLSSACVVQSLATNMQWMDEGRAPGFPLPSFPWLRSSPALCSVQCQAATPLGAQPGGWSWGSSPCTGAASSSRDRNSLPTVG